MFIWCIIYVHSVHIITLIWLLTLAVTHQGQLCPKCVTPPPHNVCMTPSYDKMCFGLGHCWYNIVCVLLLQKGHAVSNLSLQACSALITLTYTSCFPLHAQLTNVAKRHLLAIFQLFSNLGTSYMIWTKLVMSLTILDMCLSLRWHWMTEWHWNYLSSI